MTGRIYRVGPKKTHLSAPKLDFNAPAGCVAALQSPNQAVRYLAWTRLNQMPKIAEKDWMKLSKSNDCRMGAREFQLLGGITGSEKQFMKEAIKDRDPDFRICALRPGCELKLDVFFSSRRRHTRSLCDWSSDVCSSD